MSDSTHRCTGCLADKPRSEFGRNSRSPSGLKSRCRSCTNEYERRRLAATPGALDARREAVARWAKKNPERHRADSAAYYARNRDAIRTRRATVYANNTEKFAAANARFRDLPGNREVAAARSSAWRAANPERHRDLMRVVQAARRARIRRVTVVAFSQEQLLARLEYFGRVCWMCRGPFEHLDHVKPLAKHGPHMLANLRPACGPCNTAKSDKWDGLAGLAGLIKS